MYKMRKVFDITDMPEDVKAFTYNYWQGLANRSYISYEVQTKQYVGGFDDSEGRLSVMQNEDYSVLDAFLERNGCFAGEQVIILYWW